MLEKYIRLEIEMWAKVGRPAFMPMFVLNNGRAMEVGPLIGEPGTPKECFCNAALFALDNSDAEYVEGYFMRPGMPIAVHHAWCLVDGKVMDNTILDAPDGEYYGVVFDDDTLLGQLRQNDVYGLLDTGRGLNLDLMFEIEPALKDLLP